MRYPIEPVAKPRPGPWSQLELETLKREYPQRGKLWCSERLGRTLKAVAQKASDLGLKQDKSSPFFEDWQRRAARSKVGKKRPEQSAVMRRNWDSGAIRKTPEQLDRFKASAGDEYWHARSMKAHATRARNGTHSGHAKTGAYGAGWRTIDGRTVFFRSRWEANYARWLQLLQDSGKIESWEHEPETFWFAGIKRGTLSYLPDFRVTRPGGSVEYHEVKGWMTPRSRTAIARMAKYHPKVTLLVIDKVQYARLTKDVSHAVQGWEKA